MNSVIDQLRILASTESKLLMRHNEYIAAIAQLAPFFLSKKELSTPIYIEEKKNALKKLNETQSIPLTDSYNSEDLDLNTVAYHRVFGTVTANSYWNFSTVEMQQDLLHAENNPNISAHFIHIQSGGGEAWYLEELAKTMRTLAKPIVAYAQKVVASAAYYIASQSDYIAAATQYDVIGCIGSMTGVTDLQPMFEKWGVKFIQEFATQSDLKNKKYIDLIKGKPKQFIEEELDPIAQQFIDDVKLGRPKLAALAEDHPVLRGETFYSNKAIDIGLIDSIESLTSAIERAYDMGVAHQNKQQTRRQAINSL